MVWECFATSGPGQANTEGKYPPISLLTLCLSIPGLRSKKQSQAHKQVLLHVDPKKKKENEGFGGALSKPGLFDSQTLGCIHTCHFWSALNGPEFVSSLGPDLLRRCETLKRTVVRTKQPDRVLRWSRSASKRTLVRFAYGLNTNQPRSEPTTKGVRLFEHKKPP
ncbi:hypothetical protein GOODEAATRI_023872 [Goodea atripinnis]|uniref:Uncharacterized protein n=1 Tax=Goodea atripinnis TaxID=208336 RepID=A0ABV0NX53_9TELE